MRILLLLALAAAAGPAGAAEDRPPPGASSCSGCHGPIAGAAVPTLTGLSAESIAGALAAFRAGTRPATVMDRIAKGFTEEESRAIAAWLAARGGT
ncbi:c-type cytochrome [Methylobacterium symbioticum]|uniref:Cytochrome subunit of sulfide dehydrogenase n=1 Tax=Methylobacterium symbioticum TaxID=2584084 RepID=A0A509EJG0_9HYPH|nr:cytochrome C [Methylobacterium symbioticum]VUD74527.1 Cytochrome subunit of sulfide dehydrogenase [Methylobacterium symbioticum]